ncbi:hypothetical protein JHK87_033483 [Glycine soja]|nr:hypothetical protein JHK87_033483 [Glycine soja]
MSSVHENNNVFDSILMQQCFSVIAKSDPLLPGSITRAKPNFILSVTQWDDIPFEDLSSIQLSSTRVIKHIKTE